MTTRSRLITTVFRPDVWFIMPPACNVIFPEECTNVSYSRQMMRETTRLELQTFTGILSDNSAGVSAELIQQYYFAPALVDDSGLPTLPDRLGNKSSNGYNEKTSEPLTNVFYTHEKFSGIIPKIERIPDTAFYAAIEANADEAAGATQEPVTTVQQYAQRVALFNFLRNRYLARQANVSGNFMPRLAAGFPALIVNRPAESDTDDPTHFIGMITNISHTLNQDGGVTSLSLAYARPHTIAREEESFLRFLAALTEDIPAKETNASYANKNDETQIDTLNFQLRGVAQKMVRAGENPLSDLYTPLSQGDYEAANSKAGEYGVVLLRAGIQATAWSATVALLDRADIRATYTYSELFDQEPTDAAGSAAFRAAFGISENDTVDTFSGVSGLSPEDEVEGLADAEGIVYPVVLNFSLTEAARTVDKSFEEIMMPPWFSDVYSNSQVSAYYRRLLGCPSMGEQFGDVSSVENAARSAVSLYSAQENVLSNAGDPEFVYLNTRREIPTQAQVLEFHRFAYTDVSNPLLYGLDTSGGGVKEDNIAPVARNRTNTAEELVLAGEGSLDPRQERRSAVKSYQDQLLGRRAFRG